MKNISLPKNPHARIAFYADDTASYAPSKGPSLLQQHLNATWTLMPTGLGRKATIDMQRKLGQFSFLYYTLHYFSTNPQSVKNLLGYQAKYLGVVNDKRCGWSIITLSSFFVAHGARTIFLPIISLDSIRLYHD
jgi:hypothetical protein